MFVCLFVVVVFLNVCYMTLFLSFTSDGITCASMDLLMPSIGEVVGGGQREERLDFLLKQMKHSGVLPSSYGLSGMEEVTMNSDIHKTTHPYQWYIDLRRFGSCKHSGYGIGFERFVSFLCGVRSVRDVTPFPRYSGQTL